MDDVIKLITVNYIKDEEGNQIPDEEEREVLCQVQSVGRTEFYQAAQVDMHPEYLFILTHYKDYRGEKFIRYTDWMGREVTLYVTRAYRVPGTDRIELTAEERTGYGPEYESVSGSDRCPDRICPGSSRSV